MGSTIWRVLYEATKWYLPALVNPRVVSTPRIFFLKKQHQIEINMSAKTQEQIHTNGASNRVSQIVLVRVVVRYRRIFSVSK